jgi:putative FmdB family regulatory protein
MDFGVTSLELTQPPGSDDLERIEMDPSFSGFALEGFSRMPLYEYECKQCHQRLEKIQSFSAPHETICPKCGGELERVISAPAIQFKGAGWYVNDYAKSGGKPATSSDSAGKSDGKADTSAAASDSKPDSGSSKPAASTTDSSSSSSNNNSSNSSSSDAGSGKSSAGSSSSSKSSS